jgi:hypothetical protein
MTKSELTSVIRREIGTLKSQFESADFDDALTQAERDTGFSSTSNSNAFQLTWLKHRAKRHLYFVLTTESAHKFKFKQVNLQHRFANYIKLVELMDKEYESVLVESAHEFAQVSATQLFGHKADAGFSYDHMGRETTHDDSQEVVVEPIDSD